MKTKLPLLVGTLLCLLITVSRADDEYDTLRTKWHGILTGGPLINTLDPDVASRITEINVRADALLNGDTAANPDLPALSTSSGTYLWSDLAAGSNSDVTKTYDRIRDLAYAHETVGSTRYHNTALRATILYCLDWMYAHWYNEGTSYNPMYWFDWEIAAPVRLLDTVTLMYPYLSATQIANTVNAVNHFTPSPDDTGANRVWKCRIVALRGIIAKDAAKIEAARSGLGSAIAIAGPGDDGFDDTGGCIQHNAHPYTSAYGVGLIRDAYALSALLRNSTWELTTGNMANLTTWVYKGCEPLMVSGAMMEMNAGRTIARYDGTAYVSGRSMINALIYALETESVTNPAAAADFKRMIKAWIQAANPVDPFLTAEPSIWLRIRAKQILTDAAVTPRPVPQEYRFYSGTDRAVARRQNWAFGLALFSSRIEDYEVSGGENLKGWHTGSGMTYLYTPDTAYYVNEYWPTIDARYMPGTTICPAQNPPADRLSTKNWVGGAELGLYGVAGMDMEQVSSATVTLRGKKSWFTLDQEIVCLGADIDNTSGSNVYTVVENRQLNGTGNNALTVNNGAKSTSLGWSETMTGVNWAHLAGNVAGSDIGYYFPTATTVLGLREARTGKWHDISSLDTDPYAMTDITRNYLSLRLSHGTTITDQTYAYTLLPTMTASQVFDYAAAPGVTILENSPQAQGVAKSSIGVTAINFWQDAVKTVGDVTASKKSAFIMREDAATIEITVSDPTWANTGTLTFTVNRPAVSVNAALTSSGVTVTQTSPTIQFTVAVSGIKGRPKRLVLNKAAAPSGALLAENFNAGTTGAAPAGWTNTTAGGTVTVQAVPSAADKSMRLLDSSASASVSSKKGFTAATGSIVAQFRAKAMQTTGVTGLSLRDSAGTNAVTVAFNGTGSLYTYDGATVVTLQSYAVDTWYGFLIVADPTTDRFDLYLDAGTGYALVASQKNFRNAVANLGEVYLNTSTPAGTAYYDDILVETPLFNEKFDTGSTGTAPAGWTNTTAGGTITVQDVPSAADKSMRVLDSSGSAYVTSKKSFTSASGLVIAEFKGKAMQTTGVSGWSLRDSAGTNAVTIAFNSNGFLYTYDGATLENIQTYTANTWYGFRILADPATDRFDLYIDTGGGFTLVSSGNNFRNAVTSLGEVYINTFTPTGTSYYDNISVH